MTNCMTWNMKDPEPFLEVDVRLKVTLEVVYCTSDSFFRNFILVQSYVALSVSNTASDGLL